MRRGYHIRIVLYPKSNTSSLKLNTNDSSSFIPASLFQQLPAQKPRQTTRQNAIHNSKQKDYRYGPIRLDWVEFDKMSTGVVIGKEKEPGRGTATATFVPHVRTKEGSTNLPEGTVHVYRETSLKARPSLEASTSAAPIPLAEEEADDAGGMMLAVLAVPSWMTPSDFLTFVAPAAEGISHLRMIRQDSVPNRSIVVINFLKAASAAEFIEAYNGKPFNSMEPETCHVVRILSVQIDTEDTVAFTTLKRSSMQGAPYELPTCPVCLERMDSAVTGLITVPCSHTFHCMCLSKWGDSRCPVCRYSQTLMSSHPASATTRSRPVPFANVSNSTPSVSACVDCSSTTNLWICLICGNIGCGRYGRAHAHAHYESTTHLYALELETQRVWDYAGDGYVHRLIQNKTDGKLVELPSASMGVREGDSGAGMGPGPSDALSAEKIEAIGIEYSYLLTSQLDSQREYYEEQGAEFKTQIAELSVALQGLSREVERERVSVAEERERRRTEEEARLDEMHRDKVKAEKRAEKLAIIAKKMEKELREERAVSEGLMKNLGMMKEKIELADKEKAQFRTQIADLEDQVRDVMFFLQAKDKIESGGGAEAEAAGGSVEVPVPTPPISSRKKKSKRG
ncbi:hypothetical protein HWV62_4647 [Athelia sp. TMB]|nr:hypothetical protein HWV62_4647 [Athelia sp. TMB]